MGLFAEKYLSESKEYSTEYERAKLIKNWVQKPQSTKGLIADIEKRTGKLRGKKVLEVGFGNGVQSILCAQAGASVAGVEVNPVLHSIAQEIARKEGVAVEFVLYDGGDLPFPPETFDLVFSTSVLEHVSNQKRVLASIEKVLKTGAVAYLSFPNRWAPRETHTGFWFVQYLPRGLAQQVLRALGSNAVEELNLSFLSFFSLKRLLRGSRLSVVYEVSSQSRRRRAFKRGLAFFGVHHSALLKTVMVVLRKGSL